MRQTAGDGSGGGPKKSVVVQGILSLASNRAVRADGTMAPSVSWRVAPTADLS